jgi:formiminotetrahydrofolate cyclodeaminase
MAGAADDRVTPGELGQGVANAVAGGPAAAMSAALAASVVVHVARGARADWADAGGAIAQAHALRARLTSLAERDADAHLGAKRLLGDAGTGGESEEARSDRDRALADALEAAASEVQGIAEAAADVCDVAAWVAEECRADDHADIVAAVLVAQAGCAAAAHLVSINLGVRPDDPLTRSAAAASARAAAARARVLPTATV